MSELARQMIRWETDEDELHDAHDRVVYAILKDFTDRRGLRQEWEGIDEDIRESIVDAWLDIARKELGL